jgi:citrate synthase
MSDTIQTLGHGFDWRSRPLDWPITTDVGPGLNGVIATETEVMWLDPSSGRLAYRGVSIDELAGDATFEEAAYLLIDGSPPDLEPVEWEKFQSNLRSSRWLPPDVLGLIHDLEPTTHPTRLLRAGVSALGHWQELRVVGHVLGLVAESVRHRNGQPSAAAGSESSLSEGLLQVLGDGRLDPDDVPVLDLLWVLYAAHGLDAPTFTSLVVASTLADPYYNVVAGLSALRGPQQGGAGETVLDQLFELTDAADAEPWVRQALASGGRIAGFGHNSYRMPDPRVVILRRTAASVAHRKGRPELYQTARALEEAATRELTPRNIHINVNLYGALLFHLLGADPPLVPCMIAVARMAGLVALVREALEDIRLHRPLSRYVGTMDRPLVNEREP